MSTQGMVSVIKGGKVVAKVVVGCNGFHASNLATTIAAHGKYDHLKLNEDAAFWHFGCPACRVIAGVMPEGHIGVYGAEDDEQVAFVRETFQRANFNPRWKRGSCDYVWAVDLDAGTCRRILSHGE